MRWSGHRPLKGGGASLLGKRPHRCLETKWKDYLGARSPGIRRRSLTTPHVLGMLGYVSVEVERWERRYPLAAEAVPPVRGVGT